MCCIQARSSLVVVVVHHGYRFAARSAVVCLDVRTGRLTRTLPSVQHRLIEARRLSSHEAALLTRSLLTPDGCALLNLLLLVIDFAAIQENIEVVNHDCLLLVRQGARRRI